MILASDAVVIGRQSYRPGAIELEVPVSGESNINVAGGESNINVAGGKCKHGIYIPATSSRPDAADDCSICNLYIIQAKPGAAYTA